MPVFATSRAIRSAAPFASEFANQPAQIEFEEIELTRSGWGCTEGVYKLGKVCRLHGRHCNRGHLVGMNIQMQRETKKFVNTKG
jgi:hypothetical protein